VINSSVKLQLLFAGFYNIRGMMSTARLHNYLIATLTVGLQKEIQHLLNIVYTPFIIGFVI